MSVPMRQRPSPGPLWTVNSVGRSVVVRGGKRQRGHARGTLGGCRGACCLKIGQSLLCCGGQVCVLEVTPQVPLKVALVTCVVFADAADEILDASMYRKVPPEECLAAEHVAAHRTHITMAVHLPRVCSQVRLAEESLTAAFQFHRRCLVHGMDVALQVILAVSVVTTVLAQDDPSALLPTMLPRPWHRRFRRHAATALSQLDTVVRATNSGGTLSTLLGARWR